MKSITEYQNEALLDKVTRFIAGTLPPNQVGDIGKQLAYANEFFFREWSKEYSGIELEAHDKDHVSPKGVVLNSKYKGNVWDPIKKQINRPLAIEKTSRTSGKQAAIITQTSGNMPPTLTECDAYAFTVITNIEDFYFNKSGYEIVIIPAADIENPKLPGYCVNNISVKVSRLYQGRAVEILQELERNK